MEMALWSRINNLKEIQSEIPAGLGIISIFLFWLRDFQYNINEGGMDEKALFGCHCESLAIFTLDHYCNGRPLQ